MSGQNSHIRVLSSFEIDLVGERLETPERVRAHVRILLALTIWVFSAQPKPQLLDMAPYPQLQLYEMAFYSQSS